LNHILASINALGFAIGTLPVPMTLTALSFFVPQTPPNPPCAALLPAP
jgi:hypothetical protein